MKTQSKSNREPNLPLAQESTRPWEGERYIDLNNELQGYLCSVAKLISKYPQGWQDEICDTFYVKLKITVAVENLVRLGLVEHAQDDCGNFIYRNGQPVWRTKKELTDVEMDELENQLERDHINSNPAL